MPDIIFTGTPQLQSTPAPSDNSNKVATTAFVKTAVPDFTGATPSQAGTSGKVPAPTTADYEKFLCGDGTWSTPVGIGISPQIEITTAINATIAISKGTYTRSYSSGGTGIITIEVPELGIYSISVTKDGVTNTIPFTVDVVKKYAASVPVGGVYGVEWHRVASPVWSRTDEAELFADPVPYMAGMTEGAWGSPFDNIYPWSGMVRTTDPNAGELVAIPKYYFKWSNDATKMKLQISGTPQPGFHVSPAHMDRGDGKGERDIVYIGRYHCSESTTKSETGKKPRANITRANGRTAIHNLGANIWQLDHAMWWTIEMLYLVEYANPNCQGTIGYGRGNGSSTENMGYTDTMPYHTGTMFNSKTVYGVSTQYRNIEGLWDNVADWCDGIYFSGANVYHILNPANFSDTAGGTYTGTRATTNSMEITGFTFPSIEGFEWAGYPSEADIGTATTQGTSYFCDNEYYSASGVVLSVGGSYSQNQLSGLFCRGGNHAASLASAGIGLRLQLLP